MKIFISWSGDESHAMAQALAGWLPQVIQSLEPFLSSADIQKGVRWFEEIGSQLEQTHFGILCLTPDNLTAPWILFEAGALSKIVKTAHVVPLLSGLAPAALTPPLSSFNAASTSKADMEVLVKTINSTLGDKALQDSILSRAFARWWPDLETKLNEAVARRSSMLPAPARRTVEDMVSETLELVRIIVQQQSKGIEGSIWRQIYSAAGHEEGRLQGNDSSHFTMGEYLRNESNAQTIAHLVNILARRKMHAAPSDKVHQPAKDEHTGPDDAG